MTPCAGRCSTVFGDLVCRGCRRFNHEGDSVEHLYAWTTVHGLEASGCTIDQILVPFNLNASLQHVEGLYSHKHIRILESASAGRKLYHALKICGRISIWHMIVGLVLQIHRLNQFGMSLNDVFGFSQGKLWTGLAACRWDQYKPVACPRRGWALESNKKAAIWQLLHTHALKLTFDVTLFFTCIKLAWTANLYGEACISNQWLIQPTVRPNAKITVKHINRDTNRF